MNRYDTKYIDKEEREIMESIEKLDVKKLKRPDAEEQKRIREAAREFLKKKQK